MHYQYALDIIAEDGRRVGQVAVMPDWKPALECVNFQGIREGRLPPVSAMAPGTVEPIWHPHRGQPYVSGFRAVIHSNGNGEVSREIPTAYFRGLAQHAAASLVEKGPLKKGEVFRYVVCAFPTPAGSMREPGDVGGLSVEDVVQSLPLVETPLASFLAASVLAGEGTTDGDLPVFVHRHVLDDALEQARQAGDFETGGVLVGRLHRDSSLPEIAVETSALIPAPHTHSQSTKLTFTAETWAAVRAAITLRQQGEIMVGWMHTHPNFCRLRNCPVERRQHCSAASPFFSAEDVHLHATCFPCAYHVALLISDSTADGLTYSLFGWRQGMVRARAFYILGNTPAGSGPQDQDPAR